MVAKGSQRISAAACGLVVQKHLLCSDTSAIGTHTAACRYDAVTRHHNRKRVGGTGAARGARGPRVTGGGGKSRIGPPFPEGDVAQSTLCSVPEGARGLGHGEKQLKIPPRAGKVLGKLLRGVDKHRARRARFGDIREALHASKIRRFPVEIDVSETPCRTHEGEAA